MLSGKARLNHLHNKVAIPTPQNGRMSPRATSENVASLYDGFYVKKIAFTVNKDYDKEEREAQWAASQSTLHGLQPPERKKKHLKRIVTVNSLRLLNRLNAELRWPVEN
ncbi:hypothetical protein Bca4012_066043 [Brassica carinata]|uniref:Uncharacterized protein n=1 Tax=Brassica carinata TaxID=52824 RepID=A0A8X7VNS1_BRACI|nr:hypothetical protein Bca52824_018365 [Brassica carinata]